MTRFSASGRERLAAGALVVGAVVFVGFAVARLLGEGGGGWARVDLLTLPLALLGADLLIAAALLTGWYPVRPVAQGLAIFGTLVFLLVLLRSGPWWMRGWSGLLTVAHVYGLVLLFALSAREHQEAELADGPEPAPEPDEPAPGAPSDEKPAEPATEVPALREPAVEAAVGESSAEAPAAGEPSVEAPAGREPSAEEPVAEEPVAEEPASGEERAAEEPASGEERAAEKPAAAVEPAAVEPAAGERPAADEPPPEPAVEPGPDGTERPTDQRPGGDKDNGDAPDPDEADRREPAEPTVSTAGAHPTGGPGPGGKEEA